MMWQIISGDTRKMLLLSIALSTGMSIWWMGITSPSGVTVFRTTWILTEALMIILFRKSPTRSIRHRRPFLTVMTALRLKIRVSARRWDCAVFMKMQPSMTAFTIRPTMFCMMRTVMAKGHCSVIILPPNPIVTWTSMEKRNAAVNDLKYERIKLLLLRVTAHLL